MKQDKKKPSDAHAHAKVMVLNELRDMAMNMMGEKVKGRLPKKDPVGPPESLSAEVDTDSGMPHQGSNGSEMDDAAGESARRIEDMGRHEPAGDQGEPDQDMHNREYAALSDHDEDDMDDDEIDSMIAELQAKKRAKSMKA